MRILFVDSALVIAQNEDGGANLIGSGSGFEVLQFNFKEANGSYDAENGNNGKSIKKNAQTVLSHEIAHFLDPQDKGNLISEDGKTTYNRDQILASEVYAVEIENLIRKDLNMDERTHYNGILVYGKGIKKTQWDGHFQLINKKDYASGYKQKQTDDYYQKHEISTNKQLRNYGQPYRTNFGSLDKILKKPIVNNMRFETIIKLQLKK